MMKKMIKTAGAASLLALAVAGTTANAEPLTSLYFEQYAGWKTTTAVFNPLSTGLLGLFFSNDLSAPPYPADTAGRMAWESALLSPAAGVQSFIDITSFKSSDALADPTNRPDLADPPSDGEWNAGDVFIITELVHTNNFLTRTRGQTNGQFPDPLWTADALADFYVWADVSDKAGEGFLGENALKVDLGSTTNIRFWETWNLPNGAGNGCGGAQGSPNPLGTECDDIFRTDQEDFAALSFDLLGYRYTIKFGLAPGPSFEKGVLVGESLVCGEEGCSDGATLVDGIPGDEIWVFTPETFPGTSSLFVTAQWHVKKIPVPEPSVLALFGAGILGLGLAGRRRKQRIQ